MTTEAEQTSRLPVLTIMIQHDPRGGRTTVSVIDSQGNPVAFSTAHQLLDAGRAALIQQETAARASVAGPSFGGETREAPARPL